VEIEKILFERCEPRSLDTEDPVRKSFGIWSGKLVKENKKQGLRSLAKILKILDHTVSGTRKEKNYSRKCGLRSLKKF
jgi:hypothetical protein